MKKKILLVDESITVQKVVSLTLDRSRFLIQYARNRQDVRKQVEEDMPDLVLFSEQLPDFPSTQFPVELETWIGPNRKPRLILISTAEPKDRRGYDAVIKKPFIPQALRELVNEQIGPDENSEEENIEIRPVERASEEFEDQRLQKIFNERFSDEGALMAETLGMGVHKNPIDGFQPSSPENDLWTDTHTRNQNKEEPSDLWETPVPTTPRGTVASSSEMNLEKEINREDLKSAIDRALTRMVPPIVEKLVQERLDRLLKEQEKFIDIKP